MCVATSCQDIVCEEEFTLCDVLKGVITKETQLGDVLNEETYREIVLAEMRSVLNFWAFGDANAEQCFENDKFYENRYMVYPSELSRILMRSYLMIKNGRAYQKIERSERRELTDCAIGFCKYEVAL